MINVTGLDPDFEGTLRTGTDREQSFKLFIVTTGIPNDFSGIIKGEKWTGFFQGKINEPEICFSFNSIEIYNNPQVKESIEKGSFKFLMTAGILDIPVGEKISGEYSVVVVSFGVDVVKYSATLQKTEESFAIS